MNLQKMKIFLKSNEFPDFKNFDIEQPKKKIGIQPDTAQIIPELFSTTEPLRELTPRGASERACAR